MTVTLRLKESSSIPIVVESIVPEKIADRSISQIAQLIIRHGNRQTTLGSLFDIDSCEGGQDLVWEGDLKSVHWIGAGMQQGTLVVKGNAGRHLGSQMSGGSIRVEGDVDDYAGCEMTGGAIRILGNAADWLGAAYPGTSFGVNRGQILVEGNAGMGVAMAMRRGTICIGGDAGQLAGWNMRAGTLMIGGWAGRMLGKGMIRGTIVLGGGAQTAPHRDIVPDNLPPTFTLGSIIDSTTTRMLTRWFNEQELPTKLDEATSFRLHHGDHLRGGRGEVLLALANTSKPPTSN